MLHNELARSGLNGMNISIIKTREIFKVQIGLNVESKVLVYNKDYSHGMEISGDRADLLIRQFGLHKFGKRKTYVYGKFCPKTKVIQLEAEGELPLALTPDW
jgi:hypothetical protein